MKINFIQISNILSFKYCENIEQAEKIEFKKDLNILIGQNGSGKSTALEVVNFIFKKIIFVPYTLNESLYSQKDISQNKKNRAIVKALENTIKPFRLEPNWDTESNEQKIRIEIELDEIDSKNIDVLITYKEELKSLACKFSTASIPDIQNLERRFTVEVTLDQNADSFQRISPDNTVLGFHYLVNYNLYRQLITLYNHENPEKTIPVLFKSFVLISSYRNYHNFNPNLSLAKDSPDQLRQEIDTKENVKSINENEQSEPEIFKSIRLHVAEKHFYLSGDKNDELESDKKANDSSFLLRINEKLNLINLKCKIRLVSRRQWEYAFEFYNLSIYVLPFGS